MEKLQSIKGLGTPYIDYASFDKQVESFRKLGIKYPISVRDASFMRLNGGSKDWTRTCHAPIYTKNSDVILARISPLVLVKNKDVLKSAVQAHRNGNYFLTDDSIYEQYNKIVEQDKNKEPEKRKAIILPDKKDFDVSQDSETARFLFQDTRQDYFDKFVKSGNIKTYLINPDVVDKTNGTIINYLWFNSPENGSGLGCRLRYLNDDGRAFGVLKSSAEGTSQKISGKLPYTQKQLDKYSRIINSVKQGKLGTSKLEKVLNFFENLKQ